MAAQGSRSVDQESSVGDSNQQFAVGLARAFGGAILFSIPMLMSMQMWSLGFYMDPFRLALFTLLGVPLLIVLSYYAGFEETNQLTADVLDAFSAYAVGFVAAASLLVLFTILGPGMSADEIIGKIAVQAVPASIGAMLARSQFNERQPQEERNRREHDREGLFLSVAGAFYLACTLAPTEELMLISSKMSPVGIIALILFSLLVLHCFVYAAVAEGKSPIPKDAIPFWTLFAHFTVVGYTIALLISVYMLWTFGRTDDMPASQILQATIVLGFPAALGAGAARLIF